MSRDFLPIWQVRDDDLEEARALRARGASVTSPNEEGELPLVLACINGNLEMARWLRSEGADVSATDEPLSATDEPLRWLRTEDAAVSATDAEGNCPAHAAYTCSPRRTLFPTGERHRC